MAKVYTYALIKTLFDENRDYFDALVPLVLNVLEDKNFINRSRIQKVLKSNLGIDVPLHILKTVCVRGVGKGFIEQENKSSNYRINQKGRDCLVKLESIDDVKRRTNSFLDSLVSFFKERGNQINRDRAQILIDTFLQENLDGLIDFISPKEGGGIFSHDITHLESATLVAFIKQARDSKPNDYKLFSELVFGSILASLLQTDSSDVISNVESGKIKRAIIFFDTNVLFSVLKFHADDANMAAKELVDLLKRLGFTLKVFDFTIDELCRVINGYLSNKQQYPSDIAIDHIYSVLRRKKWEFSDVSDFISNIEVTIRDLGIGIETTNIVLSEYKSISNESLRAKITATKTSDYKGLSTSHDLAAVDKIREIRKRAVRRIEDAPALFLTSSFNLQKVVLTGLGHNENGTICEVILDRVLANILWLKNPQLSLPLDTIIATHSRDLLIDRRVWDKFYLILSKLREEKTISDTDIENLFYKNNIITLLKELDREDTGKLNDTLVIEEIEKATNALSEQDKAKASERASIEKKLFESQTAKEKEQQDNNAKIIKIKGLLRIKAEKSSNCWTVIVGIFTVCILWVIEFLLFSFWYQNIIDYLPITYSKTLDNNYGGIGLAVASLTFVSIWFIRKKISPRIMNMYLKKYLKEINL